MMRGLTRRIFGTTNERVVKAYAKRVSAINGLEAELEALGDEALRARTGELRERLAKNGDLDAVLPAAFATVREAAKRTLGQRHYDVQLIGGMVLHEGHISEMATGEGKTLVSTLPVYLNALRGKGVHIITVNDYLAKRDAAWMGAIYEFLGMTVGCITHGLDDDARRDQYNCDVTYGTNNEFGFDYLRDNMKFTLESMVQREFNFAIVDEVDSILIDESRTPLIISGPAEDHSEMYMNADALFPKLGEDDYEIDEKARTTTLTDVGTENAEKLLDAEGLLNSPNLYDIENISVVHHINQALRAHLMFERDKDYIVKDGQVIIIDEFTGRMMPGRRFSDGLHQALEAKEQVPIQNENQTLASITFQNYFRMYPKLAGMTGTAATEAPEFADIYRLDVTQIPTNEPCVREDSDDEVYRTADEKWKAIIARIEASRQTGQPVLVGTTSIEKSELLSGLMKDKGIEHNVLNARYHEQEAGIIAQAGGLGAVTIATNMAGRGTDIQLGGNIEFRLRAELEAEEEPARLESENARIRGEVTAERDKVLAVGGLLIIGSERHEARRIDNQLRGRSGRQGDPGASVFFLSLEDDLMRIFGSERMDSMLSKLGLREDEAIIHPWINKALEKAQQKVEARNYEIRKNLLKFDDVMNDQRKVVYEQRKDLMRVEDVSATVSDMRHEVIEDIVDDNIPEKAYAEEWDTEGLTEDSQRLLGLELPITEWAAEEGIADEEIRERITEASDRQMAAKVAKYGAEIWRMAEKSLLLQILDQTWKDHLLTLDHLRQGIGLRAYAQRDPLNEYKQEAFSMFESMLSGLREQVTQLLTHIELRLNEAEQEALDERPPQETVETRQDPAFAGIAPADRERAEALPPPPAMSEEEITAAEAKLGTLRHAEFDEDDPTTWGRTGRNAPCPCGSGKKYKQCHGKLA
ncbi:MAG: preprotein translocase subunit SecA [Alphaproteobacteria bacterium]|jgi:preprotein translocase subunit SecA|nr:preprotein translocase subunit SecA [Alphaproteobacteria bacterium]